jgi:hypothetical protein
LASALEAGCDRHYASGDDTAASAAACEAAIELLSRIELTGATRLHGDMRDGTIDVGVLRPRRSWPHPSITPADPALDEAWATYSMLTSRDCLEHA